MNDHVAKPFDPDTLTGMLAFWSGRSSIRYQESTPPIELAAEKQALIAPEQAVLRIDGNRILYRSLLAMFLEHHEHTPAELQQLMVAQDQKKMKAVAHRLTSEASHLGLVRLAKVAGGLQTALRGQTPDPIRTGIEELIEAFEATVPEINAFLSRPSMLPPPPSMPRLASPCELVPAIRNIGRQLAEHKLDALRGLAELEHSIADEAKMSALREVTALAEQLKFAEAAARLERFALVVQAEEAEAPA
jgi:HPt (histidine-containing phosphotransfer) domain-containing protein